MFARTLLTLLCMLSCVAFATAQDHENLEAQQREWLQFFVGEWTREVNNWTAQDGEFIDRAKWSCRLAADGNGSVGEGRWDESGDTWLRFASFDDERFYFEQGVAGNGLRWAIDFEFVSDNVIRGQGKATRDGLAMSGEITITRTGPDSFTTTGEVTNEAGEVVMRVNAKNQRHKANDIAQGFKNWMEYLEGEWEFSNDTFADDHVGQVKFEFPVNRESMLATIDETGGNGIELAGWQSDRNVASIVGFNSQRGYWELEYTEFPKSGPRGTIRWRNDDDVFTGDFVITIEDDDHFSWKFNGKSMEGESVENTATYVRKKR